MFLSKRIQKIEESGIRKIFDLAAKNKGDFINLSIGQPDFATPFALKESAQKAIADNHNSYTPSMGLPIFREKIAGKLNKKNNIPAKTEEVMVTSGVAGAIFLALSAVLDPGDEVILPDPYFVLYEQVLNYLGVNIVHLDTYPDFHIDSDKLSSLITDKTKMIILNSPNNPTGAVYSEEELRMIAEIARDNKLLILSDEIYEDFDYDNKFFSVGSIYENTITLNGFSKSHSVTGWRVGYAHGPQEVIDAMGKLQQYTFVCAASFAQFALADSFVVDLSEEHDSYKQKRDYICKELQGKYEFNKSEGAFYLYVKNPENRNDFANELIKNKILTVPGSVFSKRSDYFRISFAVSDEDLQRGVEILKRIA